jgi:DNA-binding SARP family transcriptional activator/TolB-like protein
MATVEDSYRPVVETSVGNGVGICVETDSIGGFSLEVLLLGPLTIRRDGVALAPPASRKARALLGFLALAPRAVARSRLCELLWDVPDDPRGELRWCLSKIRRLVDDSGRARIETDGDAVRLDLSDCFVDAIEIARAAQAGVATLEVGRLRALCTLFSGEFLSGSEIERSPMFDGWLVAQRRRLRSCQAALLEELVRRDQSDALFDHLEKWREISPFDQRVHEALLTALARRGRIGEGEEQLAASARLFESEGLDPTRLRETWLAALKPAAAPTPAKVQCEARPSDDGPVAPTRRASIAVTPFVDLTAAAPIRGGPADGLAHDVITRLAKLRSLFVIAQGSVFALSERGVAPHEIGRTLDVDYVVDGSLRRRGTRLGVAVQLYETRTARIVWAEVFDHGADDAFAILDEIGDRIVASIAREIETAECKRAILRPPSSLDAWEAHHRGLWHAYRFNRCDNEMALQCFETAVRLDPTFARAHAGLSFAHFQNAFQGWARREIEIERAYAAAAQSLLADDRDPAAHWAMGRALWLRGGLDPAVVELQTAIDLSPNFALGLYTLAFVQSQSGDARAAIEAADQSRRLSPFDPLLFGMLGSRAMALVRLGRFDEAADWGEKAAARPNAHPHIYAIAAYSSALADRLDQARAYFAAIRRLEPRYRVDDFITAMRFEPAGADLFRKGARLIGVE